MQVGYFAVGIGPTVDLAWVRTIATTAERLGFSTIWAPEYVVLLEQYASKYPYSSGDFPAPTDTPIADPFTTLAYAARLHNQDPAGDGYLSRTRAQPPRAGQDRGNSRPFEWRPVHLRRRRRVAG